MGDVRSRKAYSARLDKLLRVVRAHPTTPIDYDQATSLLQRGEELMKKGDEVQARLVSLCATDSDVETQETAFEPLENAFQEIRGTLRQIIRTLNPAGATSSSSNPASINIKLPPIELPTFDGEYANWPSFKDLFKATIDSNLQLAPSQKLQYLKSALQNEPAALVKPITITDGNYKEAWSLLTERYDNEREIVHSLINKLLNTKPIQHESHTELQKLIDNALECLRALKVLKQPVDKWDNILVVVYTNKLDQNTRREWAIRQTRTGLPTFPEFTTFVTNHIRGLLATGASNSTAKATSSRGIRTHHASSSSDPTCKLSKASHPIYKCSEFISQSPAERSSIIRRLHLCFNCMGRDHRISDCRSKSTCRKCRGKHHTMLHVERGTTQPPATTPPLGDPEPPSAGQQQPNGSAMVSNHTSMETQVLLSTAVVHVKDSNGGLQVCRIFLDSGSQGTFISEDCVRRLGLKRHHSNLVVTGISSSSAGVTKGKVQLSLHNREEFNLHIQVEAHILPKVTGFLPKQLCRNLCWGHLVGLQLADPHFNEPGPVDLLIGADYVGQLIKTGIRRGDIRAPIAQETLFGWVLSGRVPVADSPTIISHVVEMNTDSILRKEEKLCEGHFIENYSRDGKGRIVVGVPFNEKKKKFGESRNIAIRRLLQVERRLKKNPHCQQQYTEFMREYEALGQMTKLPPQLSAEVVGTTNYLPHHFVINDSSSTTKLRVVFDGSAKTSSGVSLNDTLLVGATLQDDLYSLLLRFRLHNIVLKGDITKMFRQFRLRPEDAEFHRIVWRESPDLPIQDYRLETVTYGTAYAPFLATRSLQQVALESKEKYPSAAAALHDDSYVDDLMSGEATTAKTINLYNELNSAVGEFGLEFRKWSSNDPAVLEAIPEAMRETDPHSFDDDQTIKALGVQWNPTADSFTFKHVKPNLCDKLTKRILLSDLSRVFDPLGFLGAVTIRAKLLLQELWKLAVGWDEPISSSVREQWEQYQEDMKLIVDVQIPRLVTSSSATRYELHGFSDASERAYGAVVYLRVTDINKTVSVNLLTSKTRVAPLRQITLPRLELMGAVLLAELIVYVRESLKLDCDVICWCDSTITLRWIAAEPRRWKTFVANRVSKIQELIPIEAWKHVPGSTNPADLASRGVSAAELINNTFWWTGPSWLTEPTLPIFPFSAEMSGDSEERNLPTLVHHVHYDISILERFSSLIRMKRVVAHILRLSYNKRNPHQKRAGPLTPMELQVALLQCIIIAQQQSFGKELQYLKKNTTLPNSSKLRSLHPYLDSQGILRVSGRL